MTVHARRSAHMTVMIDAAEKAGRSLLRDFGEVENLQVSKKGPSDFVSAADHKSEKIIQMALKKARPSYDMLMEESGEIKGLDRKNRWIVDPLDGTRNFIRGLPHWAITIAYERQGEIIAGVIYDPLKNEMFWAEKGVGAFMNNRRLRVSTKQNLVDSMVAIGSDRSPHFVEEIQTALKKGAGLRRMGSACLNLAYVAAARLDGAFETDLKPWDTAAGALMIREAGGTVTDGFGKANYIYGGSICCANHALHGEMMKNFGLKSTGAERDTAN